MSESETDSVAQNGDDKSKSLYVTVQQGDLNKVKELLKRGADPNAQNEYYGNALGAAARFGSVEIVKLLLKNKADPNTQGEFYSNALQVAAAEGSVEIVKLLLENRADSNAQNKYYGNALGAAARSKSVEIVKLLLKNKADPNAQGGIYGNALQAAAASQSVEIVKLLLENRADPNAQGGYDGNALQAAAASQSVEIVKLLLENRADPNVQGGVYGNALQAAAAKGSLEAIELLLNNGAEITLQPILPTRLSLLHAAVASRDLAIVERLCDAGAAIHLGSQDESGLTPLHIAVDEGLVAIAKYMLDQGASPDTEDFGNTNSFQLAMRNQNREMVLLLYPRTTAGLSSISASDWRRCSGHASNCNIEMVRDVSARVVFRDESLKRKLAQMSYPFSSKREKFFSSGSNFMNEHRNGKRMFILADGSMLCPEAAFHFHCRWWYRPVSSSMYDHPQWIVRAKSAPTKYTVSRTSAEHCFLDCALSCTCYVLPENMEDWPDDDQLDIDSLKEFEGREGISWIMMKSETDEVNSHSRDPVLQSRVFFSTSEYAEIPQMATDLLLPLVLKVRSIWSQNSSRFQRRLKLMRTNILRSSGSDPSLIRHLLIDARLLEILKENLSEQIETLQSFRNWYQMESMRTLHEQSLDEVRDKMQDLAKASEELRITTEEQLRILIESTQNMIQLEFNLTSITEAQRSTSTNKSMKRLSWITFIFLPLLFIASLFGMNVDILKDNPAWWWYLPLAAVTTLLTFAVWIIFKRNKSLEGNLEGHFKWLFPTPKGEEDLEMGSKPGLRARRAKTSAFPASGKKRS